MQSEILINSNAREIRVALMENNQLVELFIEHQQHKGIVGNIYKGTVTKILPGMQVAFVDIGLEKAGFLYVGDIDVLDLLDLESHDESCVPLSDSAETGADQEKSMRNMNHDIPIQEILKEGQEIMVQVAKNPLGSKGPRITTYITLPGRYLVYMPTVDHISVSRRIEDEVEKERLKQVIAGIGNPHEGYIVRTAGQGCGNEDFQPDLNFLHRLWGNLKDMPGSDNGSRLLYEDLNLIFRSIRDLFTHDVQRLVIDSRSAYEKCVEFCSNYLPHLADKIELYEDPAPLFDHYGIEVEINRALDRKTWLKSGGYIAIDQTEALVAIDVNTGKFVGHSDPEETILTTNLEAVKEIVYQLRLRNIGGIIIVDFIDMVKEESKEMVWNALNQALKSDRSRTKILKISEIGLVEMTRKRVRESLVQNLCEPCSYCEGEGYIKSPSTTCSEIIRAIQKIGYIPQSKKRIVNVEVHPQIYDLMFEEESTYLEELEEMYDLEVLFQVNLKLHRAKFRVSVAEAE
ncbi:MAG: Rne/Rng family ribonuclease [Candidatus Nitrohelix vancouverensis]|uniref:Ribonuclease G n=1 Tax=Candidatus Nitrohelix vancouverensis TaxID=2705534 RepID=A0A7T0C173_9BACT|nr:MAG: Rne/Rng family ribonuclease [Candidatus Nitrohelix vancouverensis]